jgi:hypothetical protein
MYQDMEQPPSPVGSSRLTRWLLPLLNLGGTRQQVTEAVVVGLTTVSLLILLVTAMAIQFSNLVAVLVTRLQGFG